MKRMVSRIWTWTVAPLRFLRARLAPAGGIAAAVSPENARLVIGTGRSYAAPLWRKLVRAVVVSAGIAVYAGMQYWIALMITRLWWWFVVAFFIVAGSFVLAAALPTVAFFTWLIVSPFGSRFLGLDFRWSAMPPLTFDLIVIYSLAVMFVVKAFVNRKRPGRLILPEILLAALPAYIMISYIMGPEMQSFSHLTRFISRRWFTDAIYLAVLYFVAKAAIRKKEHVVRMMWAMVVVGTLMALVAFYEHFTGNRWYSLIVGFGLPLRWKDVGEGRASGMFDSVSAPATLVASGLFFAYHLAGWARRFRVAAVYYLVMPLMVMGAYFTYTRNVYIMIVLFVVLAPLFAVEKRARFITLAVLFFLGAAIATPIVLSDPGLNRRFTSSHNVYTRLAAINTFYNMFRHNMWFGVGWGNADKRAFDYVTSAKHIGGVGQGVHFLDNAHCTYVTVLAEQGVVGSMFYFGPMVACILYMLKMRKREDVTGYYGKDLVSMFLVSSICYMASIISWSNHIVQYPNYVFWIQIAAVVRLGELLDQEKAAAELVMQPVSSGDEANGLAVAARA